MEKYSIVKSWMEVRKLKVIYIRELKYGRESACNENKSLRAKRKY